MIVVDSITDLLSSAHGQIVVSGSHGAIASGRHAAAMAVVAAIFNDAGGGLNDAGSSCLVDLDSLGIPAAVVAHTSARIGDGRDTLESGVVSACNDQARRLGVRPGDTSRTATEVLEHSAASIATTEPTSFGQWRRQVGTHDVVILDSASLIDESMVGRVVVTGSHGGLPGSSSHRAVRAAVWLAAFNDAGVGKDEAGIGRLAALDDQGVAGIAVSHWSAEIGSGRSTLSGGVISRVNDRARDEGARPGVRLADFISHLPISSPASHTEGH